MSENYFRRRAEFCRSIASKSPPNLSAKFAQSAKTWARLADEREGALAVLDVAHGVQLGLTDPSKKSVCL
jgi:hypothetical protein